MTEQLPKKESKPKKEVKKSFYEKLGIYINTSRVVVCLNQKGANLNINNDIVNNLKEIDNLKKQPNHLRLSLAVKMHKKVRKAIDLMNQNNKLGESLSQMSAVNDQEDCKRKMQKVSEELVKLFQQLKEGGILKPKMQNLLNEKGEPVLTKDGKIRQVFSKEKELIRFSDICQVNEDIESLKQVEGRLMSEYNEAIRIYDLRKQLLSKSVKFNTSVKASVSFLLQEAIADIIKLALRDAKNNANSKVDLFNLRKEVLNQSPYAILFFGLDVVKEIDELLIRKKIYDEEKRLFDDQRKVNNKNKKSIIKSFDDVERAEGHLSIVDKKKHWKGISLNKGSVSFVSAVTKIFDCTRPKVGASKITMSRRVIEALSNLMWQFLGKLSQRFDIHRKHKSSTNPETNISFETAIEMFEIVLCSTHKSVLETIKSAKELKLKIRELKQKK